MDGATRLRRAAWARNSFISPRIAGGLKFPPHARRRRRRRPIAAGQGAMLPSTSVADLAKLIEQGLTSNQTHYMSYWGRFLQVI